MFGGDNDFSMFARRSKPVAAIVAAEVSAGRGGVSGALKSLNISAIKRDTLNRGLSAPWHDPI
jgi:predicted transcriptional regulator